MLPRTFWAILVLGSRPPREWVCVCVFLCLFSSLVCFAHIASQSYARDDAVQHTEDNACDHIACRGQFRYITMTMSMFMWPNSEIAPSCIASFLACRTLPICRHGGSTSYTQTANKICFGIPAANSSVRTTATVKDPKQILPLLGQLRNCRTCDAHLSLAELACTRHYQPRLSKLMPRYQRK